MSDELRRELLRMMGQWSDEIRNGHGSRRDGLEKALRDVNEAFDRLGAGLPGESRKDPTE